MIFRYFQGLINPIINMTTTAANSKLPAALTAGETPLLRRPKINTGNVVSVPVSKNDTAKSLNETVIARNAAAMMAGIIWGKVTLKNPPIGEDPKSWDASSI